MENKGHSQDILKEHTEITIPLTFLTMVVRLTQQLF